jgi:hypothetical protein
MKSVNRVRSGKERVIEQQLYTRNNCEWRIDADCVCLPVFDVPGSPGYPHQLGNTEGAREACNSKRCRSSSNGKSNGPRDSGVIVQDTTCTCLDIGFMTCSSSLVLRLQLLSALLLPSGEAESRPKFDSVTISIY